MSDDIRGRVPVCVCGASEYNIRSKGVSATNPYTGLVELRCKCCQVVRELEVERVDVSVVPLPTMEHIRKTREN